MDHPEHAAVGDYRGLSSGRRLCDALQRREDALAELRAALPARRRIVRVARAELAIGVGTLALELRIGPALELAVVALAQRGVEGDANVQRRGDRRGGLTRALRIARMQRSQALAREPRRELLRLRPTAFRQRAVAVIALHAALAVPLRLAVADQDAPRFSHAARPASAREGGTIRPLRTARRCRPARP